jgi:hypothetical protein
LYPRTKTLLREEEQEEEIGAESVPLQNLHDDDDE